MVRRHAWCPAKGTGRQSRHSARDLTTVETRENRARPCLTEYHPPSPLRMITRPRHAGATAAPLVPGKIADLGRFLIPVADPRDARESRRFGPLFALCRYHASVDRYPVTHHESRSDTAPATTPNTAAALRHTSRNYHQPLQALSHTRRTRTNLDLADVPASGPATSTRPSAMNAWSNCASSPRATSAASPPSSVRPEWWPLSGMVQASAHTIWRGRVTPRVLIPGPGRRSNA